MKAEDTVMNHRQIIDLIVAWRKKSLKTEPPKTVDVADLVISTAEVQAEISFKVGKTAGLAETLIPAAKAIEASRQAGRKEVVDLMTIACANGNTEKQRLTSLCDLMRKYEAKPKEWGIKQ